MSRAERTSAPTPASPRFLENRWIAQAEAARARRRRIPLPYAELLAAAEVGLWETDRRAAPDNDPQAFERWARKRCRGAILDAVREATEGGRRGANPDAYKPYAPAPGAIGSAQAVGTLPLIAFDGRHLDLVSPDPDPEQALVDEEAEAKRRARLAALLRAIDQLKPRHREVVLRVLAGERGQDIGRSLGVSAPRVSQIYTAAVERVRALVAGS